MGERVMFKNVYLEDILLCSPYERRESRNLKFLDPNFLTEQLFMDSLYSYPFLKSNEKKDALDVDEEDPMPPLKSKLLSNVVNIDDFRDFLESDITSSLFVRGYSGTGKTTFIHAELYNLQKDNIDYLPVFLDLQNTKDTIYMFKQKWENEKCDVTFYKLYALLLEYIASEIDIKSNENEDGYKKRIASVFAKYKNKFSKLPDEQIDTIFSVIGSFIDGKITYDDKSNHTDLHDTFCKQMFAAIKNIVSFDDTKKVFSISNLIMLISIFLFCSSKDEAKYFIVLDNIEYYLDKNIVYDKDITEIVDKIHRANKNMEIIFDKNDLRYIRHFTTIFVVRDTTQNMIRITSHEEDYSPNLTSIDISTFFDIDDIIQKKINYFNSDNKYSVVPRIYENIILKGKFQINLLKKISKDKTLSKFANNLYINNKRRLTMYLLEAIKNYQNSVNKYILLMDKVTEMEEQKKNMMEGYVATINAYKDGARSIIKRMLLDLIQSKSEYFGKIRTLIEGDSGLGIARRILIYLHNKLFEDDKVEYVGFYTLLKDIFISPFYTTPLDTTIHNLAEILCLLADRDLERTHWCQLVVLKYGEPKLDPEPIKNEILRQYNDKKDDEKYGIKITAAGFAFVYFSPTFEYYACRYNPSAPALFDIENKEKLINHLTDIKNHTMKCIDHIIDKDKKFFNCGPGQDSYKFENQFSTDLVKRYYLFHSIDDKTGKLKEEQLQAMRIINSHIGYLNEYRLFLINEKKFDKQCIEKILGVIGEYIDKWEYICDIKSEVNGEIHFYVGIKNVEKLKKIAAIFKEQLGSAINNPDNGNYTITGRQG